jgi:hypothetical protein
MRKDLLLPGVAVAGGALGLAVRIWQLRSAYNQTTQLFRHGAPATIVLLALTLVLAAAVIGLCQGGSRPTSFLSAYRCPDSVYLTATAVSAFLFVGAGVLGLMEGMDLMSQIRLDPNAAPMGYPIVVVVCALLCFPTGLTSLWMGQDTYRGHVQERTERLSSAPAFAGIAWVFVVHLNHGTDPVLMRYGFALAAAMLLTLTHYFRAGMLFDHPHPHLTAQCGLLGFSLGVISLANSSSWFNTVVTLAFAVSALTQVYPLLRSMFGPPWSEELLARTQVPEPSPKIKESGQPSETAQTSENPNDLT